MTNLMILNSYTLPLPVKPLEIRKAYSNGYYVGYFHILGMPNSSDRKDFTCNCDYVLISAAQYTGRLYPAQYNVTNDTWEIIAEGNEYKAGEIVRKLPIKQDATEELVLGII